VVHVLTNITNENPAGCAAVRAAGGVGAAAALVPWCASLEGLIPGAGPTKEAVAAAAARSGQNAQARGLGPAAAARQAREDAAATAASGAGYDLLNSSMCLLVNLAAGTHG